MWFGRVSRNRPWTKYVTTSSLSRLVVCFLEKGRALVLTPFNKGISCVGLFVVISSTLFRLSNDEFSSVWDGVNLKRERTTRRKKHNIGIETVI